MKKIGVGAYKILLCRSATAISRIVLYRCRGRRCRRRWRAERNSYRTDRTWWRCLRSLARSCWSLDSPPKVWNTATTCKIPGKGKAIDFTSPRTSSGQAIRPYEMVPIRTILSPSEGGRKSPGENHQALAVNGERHPTCDPESESNPGCSGGRHIENKSC